VDENSEHELYDLDADPGEARNLLGPGRTLSPEAAGAVSHLWQRLRAWQHRTGDTVPLPDPLQSPTP
jgi:hypothetical protein